jgi:cobalt-zinc-cadmium efflux system outer membrane protein
MAIEFGVRMPAAWKKGLLVAIACAVCGCATYKPAPLKPEQTARQFQQRTLDRPELCAYLIKQNPAADGSSCPPHSWNLSTLTLAGFYYSPALEVAEAKLKVARAGIITAAQRPNPSIGLGPAYAATAVPSFAPWAIGAAQINFPIETAGKRGYRIAQARRLADASAIAVGEAGWSVRSAVRAGLVNYVIAQREYRLARDYASASERIAQLLKERVDAGASAAPELNLFLANLATARLKAAQAQSRVPEALNALAAAVGVPVDALAQQRIEWPAVAHPPDCASLTMAEVRKMALLNRLDLRRMLAQYAAADEALKLEIARQYPDINLGGGYSWEVNENLFELLPVITLPLMNHNQGPIAQARATRAAVAAEFSALQQSIIAQASGALTAYRGALQAYQQGSSSAEFAQKRLTSTQQASRLGDIDALTLTTTQLQTIIAEQARLTAMAGAQTALGALEDAIERPLASGDLKTFSLPAFSNQPDEQEREN